MATDSSAYTREQRCSAAKAKATAKALSCIAKARAIELRHGRPADVLSCQARLTKAFARAEIPGFCAVLADAPAAASLANDTSVQLLIDLGASEATTDEHVSCVVEKNAAAARYASCTASQWADVFAGRPHPSVNVEDRCYSRMLASIARADSSGPCPAVADAIDIRRRMGPVSAYLPGVNLSGRRLTGAFLFGANLVGANVFNTTFDRAELSGANFSDANLNRVHAYQLVGCPADLPPDWICAEGLLSGPGANLSDMELPGFHLAGRNLVGVYGERTNFAGANLSGAILAGARLSSADLAGADLRATDLELARLDGAQLPDADLTNAILARSLFWYSNLRGANLAGVDLGSSFFTNSVAVGLVACPAVPPAEWSCVSNTLLGPTAQVIFADLSNADLAGVNLAGAHITDTDFRNADLSGANLRGAGISRSNLTNADVSGADLSDVYWGTAICPDATSSEANARTCCGHHVGGPPLSCGF